MEIPEETSLPMKARGHPLLLGSTMDCQVKKHVVALLPEIVINGFRKAGIVDALKVDGQ